MDWKKLWKERQSTITSAAAALIIIGIAFFLFNNLNQVNEQTKKEGEKGTTTATESAKKIDNGISTFQPETKSTETASQQATRYTIVRGDSLSSIAARFYGDGNKWTLIAAENK